MANVKDLLVNGSARVIGTIYGNATSANKLNTNAGSASQPVYFSNGIPVAITGSLSNNAASATKLLNARNFKIGNTSKSFNGTADVTWTLSEIGADAAGSAASALESAKSYTDEEIANIQIGGRNLLINSYKYTQDNPFTYTSTNSDGYTYINTLGMNIPLVAGQSYVIQAKTDGEWSNNHGGQDIKYVNLWLVGNNTPFDSTHVLHSCLFKPNLGNNSWLWTCPASWGGKYLSIRINNYNTNGTTSVTHKYWDFKVEIGNKATDWTPAPEDIQSAIDGKSDTSHTHNFVKDINGSANVTFAYSKAGLNYGDYTWLAGWNGTELRAVNKSQFAQSGHTHNYAGSSAAGGSANSAVKLDSSAGSATQPIYFSGGKPVAITGTIANSISGNAASASKVNNKLIFGSKTYDGSAAVTLSASDLGLASAMLFLGTTTTAITDGATTNPVAIGGSNKTVTAGNVVLYGSKEFVWTGSAWEELGNEGSYKIVQAAVGDPNASGTSNTFISTISQDTNGKITATKKTVAVTNSAPTLAWGITSTIGTVAGTNLQVTMPANPNVDTKVTQNAITASDYTYWRPLIWGASNSGTEGFTPSTVTDGVFTAQTLSCQPSSGTIRATTFKGSLSGNASTATKLATARTINGTSFDGSTNITTASWGTARTLTIGNTGKSVNGSGNVSWSLAEIGADPAGSAASIKIGGRNLIRNSHSIEVTYTYPESSYADKFSGVTTVPLNAGTYTLSFWAKSTVNGDKIRVHLYNPSNLTNYTNSQGVTGYASDGQCDFTLTTEWTKYWVTYTVPKDNSTRSFIIPRVGAGAGITGSGTLTFKWEKLEEGNKATDWTPAPEDVQSAIDSKANVGHNHDGTYVKKSGDTMTGNLTAPSVYTSNWFRSTGSTGWYNETYDGGLYMSDSTYIRNYAGKTTRLDNLCLGADNNSYRLYVNGNTLLHVDNASGASTELTPTLRLNGKLNIYDNVTGGGKTNSLLNILYNGTHEYGIVMKLHSYGDDSPAIRFSHSSDINDLNKQVNTNWSVGMYYNTTNKFAITQDRGTNGWGAARLIMDPGGVTNFYVTNKWLNDSVIQIGRKTDTALTDRAVIGVTDGNLHLDPYGGHDTYLNFYNPAKTYFSGSTYYISKDGSYYNGTAGTSNATNYLNINNNANCSYGLQYMQPSSQTSGNDLPSNTWWHVIKMNHGNGDTYYKRLLAFNFWNDDIMTSGAAGDGKTRTWKQVWVQGNSVTGAVWNDYAEYREVDTLEGGRCVYENGDDSLSLTTKRLMRGCEITSDTWGFAQGETDKAKTPIAVAGRVLAYPYEDREIFRNYIGYSVCSGPDGTVSLMTEEEELKYPWAIVGTVSAVPDYEEWGGGEMADRPSVKVDGRIWIKVK